jgi:NADH-quinone oxidoreductase subunit G
MDYDQQPSRVELGRKDHKGKALSIGSGIMLDQERCILCARCTRFFDEVTETHELAIYERGDNNKIDITPGHPVDNKYAGNVVDICPVGALTEKDFRFRMRVWYLHRTPSVCGGCERGCSIDIHHHRGRIYRFKPRFNPDVNSYWMCDEGRHGFPSLQNETRLSVPLAQSGDELVAESWGEAVRRAAGAIKGSIARFGADSVGALIGADATNEEAYALKKLVGATLGSASVGAFNFSPSDSSADDNFLIRGNKNPNTRGLSALGIADGAIDLLANAVASGKLKSLIVLRADPVKAMGEDDFIRRFGALDYLVVLSTDANETCQMANQVWPIATYAETDGSFTNFKGRVQRIRAAFAPPGESVPAIDAIARLGHAIDGIERPTSAASVFASMALEESAFKGLSLEGLGPHGADIGA